MVIIHSYVSLPEGIKILERTVSTGMYKKYGHRDAQGMIDGGELR